jgi:hypothetical protein
MKGAASKAGTCQLNEMPITLKAVYEVSLSPEAAKEVFGQEV